MKISQIGEFGLIDLLKKELPPYPDTVIKGIGDDTAVLQVDKHKLQLLTTDMLTEGIHFSFTYATPFQVGAKALNVNISDIAAMGGVPTFATVAIGVPGDTEAGVVRELYRGIGEMAGKYNVSIVGGDTVAAPLTVINITLIGEVEPGKQIYRSGARPGDKIYLTGPLGGSAAGLFHLQHPDITCAPEIARQIEELHLVPEPRLQESTYLADSSLVSAMNDISDGLASELYEICQSSGVGCCINEDKIPVHQAAINIAQRAGQNALEWALYGGEDYQLVFTVPADKALHLENYMQDKGTPIINFGEITTEQMQLVKTNGDKVTFSPKGYNHFTKM